MLEQIKAVPIGQILDALGVVVKGKKALCPLHNDRKPSLVVDHKRNLWHCFVCSCGGDGIRLVEKVKGFGFRDALIWINGELGLGLSQESPKRNHYLEALNASYESLKKSLDDEYEKAINRFNKIQKKPKKDAHDYNFEMQYHDICDSIERKLRELENARSKFRANASGRD